MAQRVEIDYVVQNLTGSAVEGAVVQVNHRNANGSSGSAATVYLTPDLGTTLSNPLTTNSTGRIDGWLDEGLYNLIISGIGIVTYTQPFDAVSGSTSVRIGALETLGASVKNVKSPQFGAIGDGVADDQAAIMAAIDAAKAAGGGVVYFPAGTYLCSTGFSLANASGYHRIAFVGEGFNSIITYSGSSGYLFDIANSTIFSFRDLCLKLQNDSATALRLNNAFGNKFIACRFEGAWSNATDTSYRNQTGIQLTANAGDNSFIGCDITGMGVCVDVRCLFNTFTACHFATYRIGLKASGGGSPNQNGLLLSNCQFNGDSTNPTKTQNHILIDSLSGGNEWWISNCTFESAQNGWIIGSSDGASTGNVRSFSAINCRLQCSTKWIVLNRSSQTRLDSIQFVGDSGAIIPAESDLLTISSANAIEGTATNLIPSVSGGPYSISNVVFPSRWTHLGRKDYKIANFEVLDANGAFIIGEASTPSNPSVDRAVVFCRDNGSGKTELRVRFHTGSSVLIATEP